MPSALAAVLGEQGPLPVPPARALCVLLVDGFGVDAWAAAAPGGALRRMQLLAELDAGFPSTTATSLATLGTGRPPGEHGLAGYTVALPDRSALHHHLRWDGPVVPEEWQPLPTVFETGAAAGVAVTRVGRASFEGSGLTRAALRGGRYVAAEGPDRRRSAVIAALADGPALVYAYISDLDFAGHGFGPGSPAWRAALNAVDAEVAALLAEMPSGAALLVTGDHGMVGIRERDRVDLDADSGYWQDVVLLGGEPRARHVYTRPGTAEQVAATWRDRLGGRAWVLTRTEAVAAGWFGPVVTDAVADRIGDVVVAATEQWALVSHAREPKESVLAGMHGSLTPAEQSVPLLHAAG